MERNVREFLRETGAAELKARHVLSANKGCAYLLQGKNVLPLIDMMREHRVSKLVSHDGKWFLTAEGRFSNPRSREAKEGLVKQLEKPGNVFWGQNPILNPYYDPLPEDGTGRYQSTRIRPLARITLDRHIMGGQPCIRNMPITVGEIVDMVAQGRSFEEVTLSYPSLDIDDIREALEYAAKKASQVTPYLFRIDMEQEEDGRWSADIPALAGCAAWCYTRNETLEALSDVAQTWLELMEEDGSPLTTEALAESEALTAKFVVVII